MDKLQVIKIGGNILDDVSQYQRLIAAVKKIKGCKLIVHGGGKVATRLAEALGIKTQMLDGRRITNKEMIQVVTMSYAGTINKRVVADFQKEGINAIGLTGADGNLIEAKKRPIQNGVDFGWVGDVSGVNTNLVETLLSHEMVPVVAPLTHDLEGHLLNTNADTIAKEIAVAMASEFQVTLNYCFELGGVLTDVNDTTSIIKELTKEAYQVYTKNGKIKGGMIPKLDNAFHALEMGVKEVRITNVDGLTNLQNKNYNDFTRIH